MHHPCLLNRCDPAQQVNKSPGGLSALIIGASVQSIHVLDQVLDVLRPIFEPQLCHAGGIRLQGGDTPVCLSHAFNRDAIEQRPQFLQPL